MYQSERKSFVLAAACLVALISASVLVEGQIFDKILSTNNNNNNDAEVISNGARELAGERQQPPPIVSKARDILSNMMTVNVP